MRPVSALFRVHTDAVDAQAEAEQLKWRRRNAQLGRAAAGPWLLSWPWAACLRLGFAAMDHTRNALILSAFGFKVHLGFLAQACRPAACMSCRCQQCLLGIGPHKADTGSMCAAAGVVVSVGQRKAGVPEAAAPTCASCTCGPISQWRPSPSRQVAVPAVLAGQNKPCHGHSIRLRVLLSLPVQPFDAVSVLSSHKDTHVTGQCEAPVPDGLTDVCLVPVVLAVASCWGLYRVRSLQM